MRQCYIRLLFVSVCALLLFVSVSFANYISPSHLTNYSIHKSSSAIMINDNSVCKFSTEIKSEVTEKPVLWNIDNITHQNNNSGIYVVPTILRQPCILDQMDVETFYLPEPITILFLVIGMFVLFRKRR